MAITCTISENLSGVGGGIHSVGTLTMTNTIVANNSAGTAPDIYGSVVGNNDLVGNTGVAPFSMFSITGVGNITNQPALLATLGNYGGPTQTVPLLAGSPAIGTGGPITTANGDVDDSTATTITVANGDLFAAPTLATLSSGSYFTIQIDGEQMAVIGAYGSTLTVVRGVNGTSAATHSSGATVYLVSDQRSYLVPANSPPVVDIGTYQSTGVNASPTITAVNPNYGSQSGGMNVTITGTNFTGTTAVFFGNLAATSFTVDSNTQITAIDPAECAGTVEISVVGPLGTSAPSASDQFSYDAATTTSITSNPVGPITLGTAVTFAATITGDPSVGAVSFYFDYGAPDQFQIGSAVSVTNGSATSDATTALPAGADTITAIYSGGFGFDGSQGTLTIQVAAPPPTITDVVLNQDITALNSAVTGTAQPRWSKTSSTPSANRSTSPAMRSIRICSRSMPSLSMA